MPQPRSMVTTACLGSSSKIGFGWLAIVAAAAVASGGLACSSDAAEPSGGAGGGGGAAGNNGGGTSAGGTSGGAGTNGGAGSSGGGAGGGGGGGAPTAGATTGGSGGVGGTVELGPNFATVKSIIQMSCFGGLCHDLPENRLQLKLDDKLYTTLTTHMTESCGVVVKPGAPEESALVKLLKGPCNGIDRMPFNMCFEDGDEACVSPQKIAFIEQWIAAGAPM